MMKSLQRAAHSAITVPRTALSARAQFRAVLAMSAAAVTVIAEAAVGITALAVIAVGITALPSIAEAGGMQQRPSLRAGAGFFRKGVDGLGFRLRRGRLLRGSGGFALTGQPEEEQGQAQKTTRHQRTGESDALGRWCHGRDHRPFASFCGPSCWQAPYRWTG